MMMGAVVVVVGRCGCVMGRLPVMTIAGGGAKASAAKAPKKAAVRSRRSFIVVVPLLRCCEVIGKKDFLLAGFVGSASLRCANQSMVIASPGLADPNIGSGFAYLFQRRTRNVLRQFSQSSPAFVEKGWLRFPEGFPELRKPSGKGSLGE